MWIVEVGAARHGAVRDESPSQVPIWRGISFNVDSAWSLISAEADGLLVYELSVKGRSLELISWSDQAFASIYTPASEVATGTELADFPLHDSRDTNHLVAALHRLGATAADADELATALVADIVQRRAEVQLPPSFRRTRSLFRRA